MTLDGALMGSVGKSDRFDHKVIGAIASNIWSEYLHSGKEINVGHPDFLLLDLEVCSCDKTCLPCL
jgi:hypothetical protein